MKSLLITILVHRPVLLIKLDEEKVMYENMYTPYQQPVTYPYMQRNIIYPFNNPIIINNNITNINVQINDKNKKKSITSAFNIPDKKKEENTEILKLDLVYNNKSYLMSLHRFDNIFQITKSFFSLHQLPEKLIKPVIAKIFESLNNIYFIFNKTINKRDIEYLDRIHSKWIRREEEEECITSISNVSLYESELEETVFKINRSF
jgi:hypothetical protein